MLAIPLNHNVMKIGDNLCKVKFFPGGRNLYPYTWYMPRGRYPSNYVRLKTCASQLICEKSEQSIFYPRS